MVTALSDVASSAAVAARSLHSRLSREHRLALAAALSLTLHVALVWMLVAANPRVGDVAPVPVLLVENLAIRHSDSQPTRSPAAHAAPEITSDELAKNAAKSTFDPAIVQPPTFSIEYEVEAAAADALAAEDAPPLAHVTEQQTREPRRIEMSPLQQLAIEQRVLAALANEAATEFTWTDEAGTYQAQIARKPSVGDMELEQVTVDVATSSTSGAQLRTQLTFKRLAFSQFSQLIDRWDPNVQLHDDQVIGRFHSNSSFYVGLDSAAVPTFSGRVTTAARGFRITTNEARRRRAEMFQGGFQTFTGRIELPRNARPSLGEPTSEDAQVRFFEEDAHITFQPGGKYVWRSRSSGSENLGQFSASDAAYFVATGDATLHVRGVIDGKVLVYSPERIVIAGNLTYASDPRTHDDCDDFLGLVSDKIVEIARPSVTGRGDLKIEAAIFARRRFLVRDIDIGRPAVLSIYGSLTAGTVSATEPRYATKIEFDPRLDRQRPPSFPASSRFEVASPAAAWIEQEEHASL